VSSSTTTRGSGNVDLPTLITTAVASAVAAYVTSKIWAEGTLAAAAFTPVLVALLKEALAKPAEVVTRAVPVRGVVRSSAGPDDPGEHAAVGSLSRGDTPEEIEARIAQLGEAPGSSRPGRRRAGADGPRSTSCSRAGRGSIRRSAGTDVSCWRRRRSSGAPLRPR
jgi:hypothetical protein